MATTTGMIALPHADGTVSGTFTYDTVTRVISRVNWSNTSTDTAVLDIIDNDDPSGTPTVVRSVNVPAGPNASGQVNINANLGYTFPQKGVHNRYGIRLT